MTVDLMPTVAKRSFVRNMTSEMALFFKKNFKLHLLANHFYPSLKVVAALFRV
jgi:hypothetical protein